MRNIFLEPGRSFRVVNHDEPLKPHFLVREMHERPMLSESGGWDTTFKGDDWKGTAWHRVEDELPAWVGETYEKFRSGGGSEFEIIEILDTRQMLIDELKKFIVHKNKPGYRRLDILERIKELEKQ